MPSGSSPVTTAVSKVRYRRATSQTASVVSAATRARYRSSASKPPIDVSAWPMRRARPCTVSRAYTASLSTSALSVASSSAVGGAATSWASVRSDSVSAARAWAGGKVIPTPKRPGSTGV